MKHPLFITLLIITFLISGCSKSEYYFPIKKLTETKIYKYECKSIPHKTEYWKITSDRANKTLVTEAYTYRYKKYEYFKEKYDNKGSKLVEFISYRTSDNGMRQDSVIHKPKELDVYLWKTKNAYSYSSVYFENH